MTRAEVKTQLLAWVAEWAIDPHDAGLVLQQVDDNSVTDWETVGDYLDGVGYPELAMQAYGKDA